MVRGAGPESWLKGWALIPRLGKVISSPNLQESQPVFFARVAWSVVCTPDLTFLACGVLGILMTHSLTVGDRLGLRYIGEALMYQLGPLPGPTCDAQGKNIKPYDRRIFF